MAGLVALVLLLGACEEPRPTLEIEVDATRVVVRSSDSLSELVIRNPEGLVLARRDGSRGSRLLSVLHGAAAGTELWVDVGAGQPRPAQVPVDPGPMVVELDLPAGQGARPLVSGGEHTFSAVVGASMQAHVVLWLAQPGTVLVVLDGVEHPVLTTVPSERKILTLSVPLGGPSELRVLGAGLVLSTTLVPAVVELEQARELLHLDSVVFPANEIGMPETARPAGRITLPARWWRALLRKTGVGFRAQDPYGPWSFQAVHLSNRSDQPLNVVVTARILDSSGEPAVAFQPRLRDRQGDTGEVSGLLRVPPGATALARLPFYVDADALPEGPSEWVHEIRVTPLGSSEVLWTQRGRIQVQRGSTWVSLGFVIGLLGGLIGMVLVMTRTRGWIAGLRTADLVTVAVFATLSFLISGASALFSAAASALLGPFQVFLTNLADDVLCYALLATLVTLLPRPGVATLSVLLTWLMRGVALGSFSPTDAVTIGTQVFWLEGGLWLVGITRSTAWLDESVLARWIRLGTAFSVASVMTTLTGLAMAMVLYRLYYRPWYVAAVLIGPGFLYVWLACGLGTRFAHSLRAVED
jgi:hypothetical protein